MILHGVIFVAPDIRISGYYSSGKGFIVRDKVLAILYRLLITSET